jgi:hypothetical protein
MAIGWVQDRPHRLASRGRSGADWVILSACNTAAGKAEGAEALSGLTRSFFYAGACALIVSHWAVASNATVKLITGAVERMAFDKRIGRAEAMRQSMLALIDKGEPLEAHPAYWAPFVVVGEGGGEATALATSSIISAPDSQPVPKLNTRPTKKLAPQIGRRRSGGDSKPLETLEGSHQRIFSNAACFCSR